MFPEIAIVTQGARARPHVPFYRGVERAAPPPVFLVSSYPILKIPVEVAYRFLVYFIHVGKGGIKILYGLLHPFLVHQYLLVFEEPGEEIKVVFREDSISSKDIEGVYRMLQVCLELLLIEGFPPGLPVYHVMFFRAFPLKGEMEVYRTIYPNLIIKIPQDFYRFRQPVGKEE